MNEIVIHVQPIPPAETFSKAVSKFKARTSLDHVSVKSDVRGFVRAFENVAAGGIGGIMP